MSKSHSSNRPAPNNEAIVVGGGLSGLTAASYLAAGDCRVTVLDRATQLGGRAATRHFGDFAFNLGPHALYCAGEARRVLFELGVPYSARRAPATGLLRVGQRLERLPSTTFSALTCGALRFSDKLELGQLMGKLAKLDPRTLEDVTVTDWLQRNLRSERARAVVKMFFRLSTYANDPCQAASVAVQQLQLGASDGVEYLDEGWQTLVDGLASQAEKRGARLRPGSAVRSLERGDGKRWRIELEGGERMEADIVIIAGSPALARRLLEHAGVGAPTAVTRPRVPARAACLDIALDELPQPKARLVLDLHEPLYLSAHSETARLAPSGGALIHVAKYLSSEDTDPASDRAELEGLLDLAQPGWRSVVVEQRFMPKITVAHHVDQAADGGTSARPSVEIPNAPGVFLSGDWVGSTGWLADAAVASGKSAAQVALAAFPHAGQRAA